MKQAIHTNDHTNTRREQCGWRRYRGYIIVPFGIGAFFASCLNNATGTKYHEIEYDPCDCKPEEFIDSRGIPYYYDTPVDWPIPDDAIGGDTAQAIYEWSYVEPPCDNHLPKEAMEFPMAKQEGGKAMGP